MNDHNATVVLWWVEHRFKVYGILLALAVVFGLMLYSSGAHSEERPAQLVIQWRSAAATMIVPEPEVAFALWRVSGYPQVLDIKKIFGVDMDGTLHLTQSALVQHNGHYGRYRPVNSLRVTIDGVGGYTIPIYREE